MNLLRSLFFIGLVLMFVSCAPGTDGIVVTQAEPDDSDPFAQTDSGPIKVVLPPLPAIVLPDLSSVGDYDELLQERLRGLTLQPTDGVEVVTVECEHGDAVYEGNSSSDLFDTSNFDADDFTFSIDPETGGARYYKSDGAVSTALQTNGDGSGSFLEQGRDWHLSIEAFTDGSGRYFSEERHSVVSIDADAEGAGVFYDQNEETLTTITINNDASGALYSENLDRLMTIDAHQDGSGDFYLRHGGNVTTLRIRPDGSWELSETSFGNSVAVKVNSDGTGDYRSRGTGISIALEFEADGTTMTDGGEPGPPITIPAAPKFVVADRFPPLGTLASISPPCATILRFDSALLFDINESVIRPEAAELLIEVAPALIEAGRSIEVNGHTDANGTDEHNLELSFDRANSVAEALRSLGVEVEMTINGFGESQPVAPNYREDGSDDEAGQRANRRVELVIHE